MKHLQKRKRIRTASHLTLSAICAAFVAAKVQAATIQISGSVNSVSSVTPGTPATLDSNQLTDGVTDFPVVTVKERSNKNAGYKVTLQSANAGSSGTAKLLGAQTGEAITYTIKYGGSSVTFVNGQAVVTDASDKTPNSGIDKVISVSVPSGFPAADEYSDSLTLTLVNK